MTGTTLAAPTENARVLDPLFPPGRIGSTAPGHYGRAGAQVELRETIIGSSWNLQGNPQEREIGEVARALFDIALPTVPNACIRSEAITCCWLGPASFLLLAHGVHRLSDFAPKRDAMNAVHGALFELSAARMAFEVAGECATEVLAAHCPLDLYVDVFPPGTCAQSLLGHINVLYYRCHDRPAFVMMVARSFARDAWQALCGTSAQFGYVVAPPRAFA